MAAFMSWFDNLLDTVHGTVNAFSGTISLLLLSPPAAFTNGVNTVGFCTPNPQKEKT